MDGRLVFYFAVYSSCILISFVTGENGNMLARGFNDNIDWVTLEEGTKLAKETNRPMMVIIHKSWCGACKALKPEFANSIEIQDLSKSFIMVNTLDDEEPVDPKFTPDGGYIPRIIFFDPQNNLMNLINEQGNEKYKYYYSSPDTIVNSMKKCLDVLKGKQPTAQFDEL